jgi:hypothetical protein
MRFFIAHPKNRKKKKIKIPSYRKSLYNSLIFLMFLTLSLRKLSVINYQKNLRKLSRLYRSIDFESIIIFNIKFLARIQKTNEKKTFVAGFCERS